MPQRRHNQSLVYDAYNKTKHDRANHFADATLEQCLFAVAANVVLFCTRWSAYFLTDGSGPLAALVNQLFAIELSDPDVRFFYVQNLDFPENVRQDLMLFDRKEHVTSWKREPLVV